MNMQPMAPPIGMVPLARAAQLLSGSGDPIHPSNLSRYLERWPGIPNEKRGKVRMVDFEKLAEHRRTNIGVVEKGAMAPPPAAGTAADQAALPLSAGVAEPEELDAPKGSAIAQISEQIKRIQLRQAELDLAEREKELLPRQEVFALISETMGEFIAALQRQDGEISQTYGSQVAADIRRRRKAAQAAASATLAKRAKEILAEADAAKAVESANPQEETKH